MTAVLHYEAKKTDTVFLGKFVNGEIKDSGMKDLDCALLRHTSHTDVRHKNKKILVAEAGNTGMTYVGKNFGEESAAREHRLMRHYVGIYDEKSGKMRICDAELFHMQPYFPEEEKNVPEPVQEKSYIEKISSLVEAFGSHRKKASFEKKFRNKMDEDTIQGVMSADAQHGKQLRKAIMEEEQASAATQIEMLSPLPVCHTEGATVQEVYPISDIITDEELDSLQSVAAEFFDSTSETIKEWATSEKYPRYILQHVTVMPMEGEVRWRRCKLLMYLHYMIQLYKMSPGVLNKTTVFNVLPGSIKKKLFDNFTVQVRKARCKPTRLKDRLAAFILLLCLHIDEFTLPTDNIVRDLQISKQKVIQLLRAMGCKVGKKKVDSTDVMVGRLTLPLDFPQQKSGARGRRR